MRITGLSKTEIKVIRKEPFQRQEKKKIQTQQEIEHRQKQIRLEENDDGDEQELA